VIAGIFLSPILSRMGLFSFAETAVSFLCLRLEPLLTERKVNRCGRTTSLWIKRVFCICGELW
jgi:hypothetical protein